MATKIHTELAFEEAIEDVLLKSGYEQGSQDDYDVEYALDTSRLFKFLKTSQSDKWSKLEEIHRDQIEPKLLQRLHKELELRGALDVIRNGFTPFVRLTGF
jgi:type I restriction enzyme R subunit